MTDAERAYKYLTKIFENDEVVGVGIYHYRYSKDAYEVEIRDDDSVVIGKAAEVDLVDAIQFAEKNMIDNQNEQRRSYWQGI